MVCDEMARKTFCNLSKRSYASPLLYNNGPGLGIKLSKSRCDAPNRRQGTSLRSRSHLQVPQPASVGVHAAVSVATLSDRFEQSGLCSAQAAVQQMEVSP